MARKLYRSKKNEMVAGVCAGIGEYIDVDPTVVRLIWVFVTIFSFGAGIIAYLIAWALMPQR